MDIAAAAIQEQITECAIGGTESYAVNASAIHRFKGNLHVIGPHKARIADPVRRKCQHWLGMAGTIGSCSFKLVNEIKSCT